MKEYNQNFNDRDDFLFIHKMKIIARKTDRSIERYVQHFIEHVAETFINDESNR